MNEHLNVNTRLILIIELILHKHSIRRSFDTIPFININPFNEKTETNTTLSVERLDDPFMIRYSCDECDHFKIVPLIMKRLLL